MRIPFRLALLLVAGPVASGATNRLELNTVFLTSLVEEARTRHPGLRAAHHRQQAARHAADGIRLWEDPMFRFGGVVGGNPGPALEMEGDLVYEVQQTLPIFGKATAMRREAEAAIGVAGAEERYRFQILRRSVVQAALQLAYADETLRIGEEDLALLDRMVTAARERLQAGLNSNLELLRLENERTRATNLLKTSALRRDFEAASLNRLLNRPGDSPWPGMALPPVAPAVPLTDNLFALGLRFEPRLQAMRNEIAMSEAGVEVTRRNRLPDLSLGVEGRQWSGSGGFREGMFTVGINVPWLNRAKYRADIDRDRSRADAARAEAEDYELDVRRELFRVWTVLDAARREALIYQDQIIPRSELAVDTAFGAWSAGRGMFMDLMEARRMLVESRLMLLKARNEQHQMIAELVTCCGIGELDSLTMLGAEPLPQPAPPAVTNNPTRP